MPTQPLRIADGMVVTLSYRLTVDGEIIADTEDDGTLEYLHGAQEILPGLENALRGRAVGERFTVTLPPEQAYGEYNETNIDEIDRRTIPDGSELEVGMVVEVEDEDGYTYLAHIAEINGDTVILDFNPPLAGKTLTYDVHVVDVRKATEEELDHGHAHGAHAHAHDYDDYDYEDEE